MNCNRNCSTNFQNVDAELLGGVLGRNHRKAVAQKRVQQGAIHINQVHVGRTVGRKTIPPKEGRARSVLVQSRLQLLGAGRNNAGHQLEQIHDVAAVKWHLLHLLAFHLVAEGARIGLQRNRRCVHLNRFRHLTHLEL